MISGLDHVAVPMAAVEEMLNFYQGLGGKITEENAGDTFSVCFGNNIINLHTPDAWRSEKFVQHTTAAAVPGCGDFGFVWQGDRRSLLAVLTQLSAQIEEAPRGRLAAQNIEEFGSRLYARDPDDNLLEFIIYSEGC